MKVKFTQLINLLEMNTLEENAELEVISAKNDDVDLQRLSVAIACCTWTTNVTLDFSNTHLSDTQLSCIIDAFYKANCAPGLTLNFSSNKFSFGALEKLKLLLNSPKCPEDLILDLSACQLGDAEAIFFARALKANNLPKGLSLIFSDNNISNQGFRFIIDTLSHVSVPRLSIDLSWNTFDDEGCISLIDLIKGCSFPEHLMIDLRNNELSISMLNNIEQAIIDGIIAEKIPSFFILRGVLITSKDMLIEYAIAKYCFAKTLMATLNSSLPNNLKDLKTIIHGYACTSRTYYNESFAVNTLESTPWLQALRQYHDYKQQPSCFHNIKAALKARQAQNHHPIEQSNHSCRFFSLPVATAITAGLMAVSAIAFQQFTS